MAAKREPPNLDVWADPTPKPTPEPAQVHTSEQTPKPEHEPTHKATPEPTHIPTSTHEQEPVLEYKQTSTHNPPTRRKSIPVPAPSAPMPTDQRVNAFVTKAHKDFLHGQAQAWGVSEGEVLRWAIEVAQSTLGKE